VRTSFVFCRLSGLTPATAQEGGNTIAILTVRSLRQQLRGERGQVLRLMAGRGPSSPIAWSRSQIKQKLILLLSCGCVLTCGGLPQVAETGCGPADCLAGSKKGGLVAFSEQMAGSPPRIFVRNASSGEELAIFNQGKCGGGTSLAPPFCCRMIIAFFF
jgi:hypothetical protein